MCCATLPSTNQIQDQVPHCEVFHLRQKRHPECAFVLQNACASNLLSVKHAAGQVAWAAAKESSDVLEKEVDRLDQLNKDARATCQQLQATVDDLSRYGPVLIHQQHMWHVLD